MARAMYWDGSAPGGCRSCVKCLPKVWAEMDPDDREVFGGSYIDFASDSREPVDRLVEYYLATDDPWEIVDLSCDLCGAVLVTADEFRELLLKAGHYWQRPSGNPAG